MVGKIGKQLVLYPSSLWKVEVTRLMRLVAISDHSTLGPIYQLQLGEERTNIIQPFCNCKVTSKTSLLRAEAKGSRTVR